MRKTEKLSRKRKTKDPCPICKTNRTFCICHLISKIDLKTRVVLVVHTKELKRTTNTGRLALEALTNSLMKTRGLKDQPVDLSDLLTPEYRTVLLYPCDEAIDLTREFVLEDPRPIQLIVPDGNWRQASKVHYRHSELKDIPRVMIASPNLSKHHLRAETTEEGMATLQAIAFALGVIEGEPVKTKLLELYEAKLKSTLLGRGLTEDEIES